LEKIADAVKDRFSFGGIMPVNIRERAYPRSLASRKLPCVRFHSFECIRESVGAVRDRLDVPVANGLHGPKVGAVSAIIEVPDLSQESGINHLFGSAINPLGKHFAPGVDAQMQYAERPISKAMSLAHG